MSETDQQSATYFVDGGPELGLIERTVEYDLDITDAGPVPVRDRWALPDPTDSRLRFDLDKVGLTAISRYAVPSRRAFLNSRLEAVAEEMPTYLKNSLEYDGWTSNPSRPDKAAEKDALPPADADMLDRMVWWLGRSPVLDEEIMTALNKADDPHVVVDGEPANPLEEAIRSMHDRSPVSTDVFTQAFRRFHEPYMRHRLLGQKLTLKGLAKRGVDQDLMPAFQLLNTVFGRIETDNNARLALISRYYGSTLGLEDESVAQRINTDLRLAYGGVDPLVYAQERLNQLNDDLPEGRPAILDDSAATLIKLELDWLAKLARGAGEPLLPEWGKRTSQRKKEKCAGSLARRAFQNLSIQGVKATKEGRNASIEKATKLLTSNAYIVARNGWTVS